MKLFVNRNKIAQKPSRRSYTRTRKSKESQQLTFYMDWLKCTGLYMTVKISVERRSLEFDSVTATERPSELLSCRTIAVLSFYWLFGVVIHPFGFDKGEGQQDER